jgi:hypothetical protein
MKKNDIRGATVLTIVAVVYILAALLIPFHKNHAVYWIAFLFGLVAIGAQAYVMKTVFLDGKSVKSKFYGFPIARIGVMYLVTQVVLSFLFMGLSAVVPAWVAVLLFVILLAVAAIGFIAADAVREEIEKQDVKLKKDTATMQNLISQAKSLVGLCENVAMTEAVQELSNSFRYSDPVSSPALKDIEQELTVALEELQRAVVSGDVEGTLSLCKRTENTLAERNRLCKLGKKA